MTPCVLIPTFDNPATLGDVVARALAEGPRVLVVDDGSGPAGRAAVEALPAEVHVLRHAQNRGKGAALRTGFAEARRLGCTHALSLDADGQHFPEDLPRLLAEVEARPRALVLGARDLGESGAGPGSRVGCASSNLWVRWITGLALPDTQTGFRAYPLEPLARLDLRGSRYELELEVLVKAAWSGLELRSVPIRVRYFERGRRVSHMGLGDFWTMGRLQLGWLLRGWLSSAAACRRWAALPEPRA